MKLHADFHDYYDTAIGYGTDSNVHYNRYTKEVEIKLKSKLDFPHLFWDTRPLLLGFCGEIYPMLEYVKRDSTYQIVDRFYAYTYKEFLNKRKEWQWTRSAFGYSDKRTEIGTKQFFIDWRQQDDALFLENKVPIWIYQLQSHNQKAVLNPKLKTYEFYRVKDANTAFQEISMYLSNILVEQKQVAAVEDKYRIEQHGFDSKTSFRKEKQK